MRPSPAAHRMPVGLFIFVGLLIVGGIGSFINKTGGRSTVAPGIPRDPFSISIPQAPPPLPELRPLYIPPIIDPVLPKNIDLPEPIGSRLPFWPNR